MTTSVISYKYYEGLVFHKEFSMFYRVMSRVLIQIKLPSQVSFEFNYMYWRFWNIILWLYYIHQRPYLLKFLDKISAARLDNWPMVEQYIMSQYNVYT